MKKTTILDIVSSIQDMIIALEQSNVSEKLSHISKLKSLKERVSTTDLVDDDAPLPWMIDAVKLWKIKVTNLTK